MEDLDPKTELQIKIKELERILIKNPTLAKRYQILLTMITDKVKDK